MKRYVVAHAGSGSKKSQRDGTDQAADAGWKAMVRGGALDAVVAAVAVMEDDERFNAGTGSSLRLDGRTIEMDAAVVDSDGRYGAVGAVERVKNPVLLARELIGMPTNFVCGEAAQALARRLGFPDHDPTTAKARKEWRHLVRSMAAGKAGRADNEWDMATLERLWNHREPFDEVFRGGGLVRPSRGASNTVGAVACDGKTFAAAASTGGGMACLRGRIGDTPVLGAGLFASERGAVACSGLGDHFLRQRLASRVDRWLEEGASPGVALRQATSLFPKWVDVVVAVAGPKGFAVGGNVECAASAVDEGKVTRPEIEVHEPPEESGEVREPGLGEIVPLGTKRGKGPRPSSRKR